MAASVPSLKSICIYFHDVPILEEDARHFEKLNSLHLRELCIDAESPAANLQALVGIMGLPSLQKLTLVLSCKAQGWVEFSRAMALRPKLKVMLDIEGFPWRLEPLKCLSDLTIHLYKVEQAAWTKGAIWLQKLQGLRRLSLDLPRHLPVSTAVNHISSVVNQVEELDLQGKEQDTNALCTAIAKFTRLKELCLTLEGITDLLRTWPLAVLPNLEEFALHTRATRFSGLSWLPHLPKLRYLKLGLVALPQYAGSCAHHLEAIRDASAHTIYGICAQLQLRTLSLSLHGAADAYMMAPLHKCTHVHDLELDVSNCDFSDAPLSCLAFPASLLYSLPTLEYVHFGLRSTSLPHAMVKNLLDTLMNMDVKFLLRIWVFLTENDLPDTLPFNATVSRLQRCPQLQGDGRVVIQWGLDPDRALRPPDAEDDAEEDEEDEDEEEVAEADWKFRGGDMGRLAVWVRGCAGAEVVWAEEGAAVAAAEGVWVPRHRAFAGLQ
uniref:Uncharacterized protein n=1 Tax=Eutreptiella gymnastica TaxID=73025 RepID=A0A7S4G0D1_9EUGL